MTTSISGMTTNGKANQEVDFEVGVVKIGEQRSNNWEVAWKKFREYLDDGRKQSKCKNFK